MAMTQLAAVQAALSLIFRMSMVSQINSVAVLPYLLPITRGEGKSLNWTIEVTGATNAVASAEGVARSSTDADSETELNLSLGWAQYDKTSSVSDLALAAVSSNFNPNSIGTIGSDLLAGRVAKQVRRIGLGIARDLYAGNPAASPAQLAGAALAIDSSGVFAGVDPATYTEWASVEQTGALSGANFDVITQFFTAIYDASGMLPEFVTVPSNVFNALRSLFRDYEAQVVREVQLARGGGPSGELPRNVKFHAGMTAFEIDGVPFIRDRHCTANTMYAWHTSDVEIQQLDPYQSILDRGAAGINEVFATLAGQSGLQLPRETIEGMMAQNGGLRPSIKLLGDRGLSREAVVYLFAQTKYDRRNTFGKYLFT